MHHRYSKFVAVIIFLFFASTAQGEIYKELLPAGSRTDSIVHHTNYSLGYDEETEQAEWVMYEMTQKETNTPRVKRDDSFRPDPQIATGSASLRDYKKSGYDRGHLAPAADMAFSKQAMSESFYMSNMSPQRPGFNRGIWKRLEERVRNWAHTEDIIVVTGGVLNGSQYIGKNKVLVPNTYYKIIYTPHRNKVIAFLLPNKKSSAPLRDFVVSVDRIEAVTGIDFFADMNDASEAMLERMTNTTAWTWKNGTHQKKATKKRTVSSSSHNIVKLSRSHICHDSSSRYYSRTKHYTPYNTLQECLDAGGRLPK
ncbi:DNA/RNA non-specific endonuclease [Halodesulfovibrio sp.]|uniref:DNA/RNA non-specific endonuclease n=1 Tax=Halodesulfovibrio sp. TaxID=1912772 RepID=UPI0025C53F05|nr:DNA/RNA non-specific endonuclease [Halodesulfovibrio sp.]